VGGAVTESFLGLTPGESASVVRVSLTFDPDGRTDCSGVLVAARTILTAKHCMHGQDVREIEVSGVGDRKGQGETSLGKATPSAVSDDLDLMLLDLTDGAVGGRVPIRVANSDPEPGDLVEIAGYGTDLDGDTGLRFAVESVQELVPHAFVAASDGASGGCSGDSGGPALRRGSDGAIEVLGVLSSGSAGCLATDRFASVAEAESWIADRVETQTGTPPACPTYGDRGRCYGDQAVWCEDHALHAKQCRSGRCGWSDREAGYRCLSHESDPCFGTSDLGECDGERNTWCDDGELRSEPCDACAGRCRRLTATGRTGCVTE
jgi:hypothetical protein